jgi:hypothetical protein
MIRGARPVGGGHANRNGNPAAMMHSRTLLALTTGLTLTAGAAFAQTTPPMRIRATIEKIDGNVLTLKPRSGADVTVTLTPDATVVGVTKAPIGDIKPGSYIGSAAIPEPDGTLKALEVTVFPPAMAGAGEGSYPWDLGANSSMTNGTVGDLVISNGRTMTVKYKGGGEKKIVVPDDVPIVSLEPVTRAMLTVGAHVIVVPTKAADGSMSASRISVGENGLVPPQ